MTNFQPVQEETETEVVATVDADKVPFKNTTVGRTFRTFFQSAAGLLLVFALSDEFRTFIQDRFPELMAFFPLATALFTALQNAVDPHIKNI